MFLIKIAVLINVRYKDSECSARFTFFIYFLNFTTPNIISLATCNNFVFVVYVFNFAKACFYSGDSFCEYTCN